MIYPERKLSTTTQDIEILEPSCDTVDVLPEPFNLPDDADEDDWIEIGQAGACTNAAATRFNGFFPETFVSVDAPPLLPTT